MTQAFNLSQFANNVNSSGQADLATGVTGTLPIANGGTGQTTASGAVNALLPTQSGNTGKFLSTDGTSASWVASASFGGGVNVTSSTDVTLTSASVQTQNINITTSGKNVILPDATTCSKGGIIFNILNIGSYPFNVKSADGFVISTVNPFGGISLILDDNTNAGGIWSFPNQGQSKILSISDTVPKTTPILLTDTTGVCASSSTALQAFTVNYSTGAFTYGTPVTVSGASGTYIEYIIPLTSTTFIASYYTGTYPNLNYYLVAGSISGTTITLGSEVLVGTYSTSISFSFCFCKVSDTELAIGVNNYRFSDDNKRSGIAGISVSGTTITLGSYTYSSYSIYSGVGTYAMCLVKGTKTVVWGGGNSSLFGLATISGSSVTAYNLSASTIEATVQVCSPADNLLLFLGSTASTTPTGNVRSVSGVTMSTTSYSVTGNPSVGGQVTTCFNNYATKTSSGVARYYYIAVDSSANTINFYQIQGATTPITLSTNGGYYTTTAQTSSGYIAGQVSGSGYLTILKGFA